MRNSFVSQEKALAHGMATGYRWWFGVPIPVTLHYNRSELPAGYIISSAEDMAHFLIAQMNEGGYRNISVLSPHGMAETHYQPVPNTYAMGWESIKINGHTLINHDGGAANFESSIFFDPEERVGVFIAANIMCALDAFSSAHGSDPLDGVTVRGVTQNVLNMATNRPRSNGDRGVRLHYVIFDLVIFVLTALLILSIMRVPGKYKLLKGYQASNGLGVKRRLIMIASFHFVLPILFFYLLHTVFWKVLTMLQPDLSYWLAVVAITVFIKGMVEVALTWHASRQHRRGQHLA
jgi:hypothetical protein